MEWTKSNQIFYTSVDELYRPCRVFLHTLGTPVSEDVCLFYEPNDSFFVDVVSTKDKVFLFKLKLTFEKYIAINCNSKTTSEIHLLPNPQSGDIQMSEQEKWTSEPVSLLPRCVLPRQTGREYYLDHRGSDFFIITNGDGAYNYHVLKAHDDEIFDVEKWKVAVEHSHSVKIEDVDVFQVRILYLTKLNIW